ncbi:MAG: glycosyltransferase [Acidimicrobiia bacterium]
MANPPVTSMTSVTSVSAFLPCYNDAPTIASMVRSVAETLARFVDDYEVIVVDDGSTDESLDVLRRLETELPFVRVIAHAKNRGYGGALQSGIAAATKEWIFYTDGDAQYDPREVARLIRAVTPGVSLAQGWKLQRGDGRVRTMIGRAYHGVVTRLFGLTVRDTDCDFRLFRRDLAEQAALRCGSGAICVEMMYRFQHAGAVCVETPVHHYPRPYGKSQFFRLGHLTRTFAELGKLQVRLHLHVGEQPLHTGAPMPGSAVAVRERARARVFAAGIGAIMVLSLGAHLWGLTRDLPIPDVDERYFVTPAAYIAASGDLNPHWFGHPGSTVIYPLALAYRVREVVFHGAPLTGAAPSIAARFRSDDATFYLMGRLWSMAFSLAALPLIFVIGRRVFGDVVGFLATALWVAVPLAVQYGRITRTDSVALFFALLTIWLCLRTLERPSTARLALAGVTAGLGVASRYFLAALAVLLVVTWLLVRAKSRATPAARWRTVATSLGVMVLSFLVTTPYFVLDWHDAMSSLSAETRTHVPMQPHGFLDNVGFYLGDVIPRQLSWIGLLAALAGMWFALRRRRTPDRILLLAWIPCVLVAISILSLHWDRWVIPALPIFALFAAYATVGIARRLTAGVERPVARRWAVGAVLVGTAGAMTLGPAVAVVALDRNAAKQSTRVVAAHWIERHVPVGSRIAVEVRGPDLTDVHYHLVQHYDLASAGTVTDYARAGYRYLLVNAGVDQRFAVDRRRYRAEVAFYGYLRDDAHRLADFHNSRRHGGSHLELYDLGPARTPRELDSIRDPSGDDEVTLRYTSPNRAGRGGGPVPFARYGLQRLSREAH